MKKSDSGVKVTRRKISDYVQDSRNANKGTARGRQVIESSFRELGAGRSLLVDADGSIIAGNKSALGAAAAGIEDVIEIETDGDTVVVVKRNDLKLDGQDTRARKLAYADNAASMLDLEFDAMMVDADRDLLGGIFSEDELAEFAELSRLVQHLDDDLNSPTTSAARKLGDKAKQIKPVIYTDELAIFEQALLKTGLNNRGAALIAVCKSYLDSSDKRADGK